MSLGNPDLDKTLNFVFLMFNIFLSQKTILTLFYQPLTSVNKKKYKTS